jgi:hypothetical protein
LTAGTAPLVDAELLPGTCADCAAKSAEEGRGGIGVALGAEVKRLCSKKIWMDGTVNDGLPQEESVAA